jgi:hypothetical protein
MPDKASVETHLAGFREGLVADGYDLLVDDVAAGKARLRITAGPEACAECLVPKDLMIDMLKASLEDLPEITQVELAYPNET